MHLLFKKILEIWTIVVSPSSAFPNILLATQTMAAEGEEEAIPPVVPDLSSITLSADQRANLVIRLLNEITVVNVA